MSRGTLDTALLLSISDTRLSRFLAGLPRPFSYQLQINYAVLTPKDKSLGLGSFPFARRYSGNRCFFLFLRVLRCFSSPGSLPYVMDWRMDDWSSSSRVSPFRDLRIKGYLLLPEAYRSLSRLSSAPSAKAFALRPCSLDHIKLFSLENGLYPLDSLLPTKIIVTLPFEIVIFLKKNLL